MNENIGGHTSLKLGTQVRGRASLRAGCARKDISRREAWVVWTRFAPTASEDIGTRTYRCPRKV
ncbi:hypothetical protein D3C74_297830 [compost metagenome]